MPPFLALLIWIILLFALLYFDPASSSKPSAALWISVIWLFIIASRLPSQWIGGEVGQIAQSLEEGNTLDRSIFSILIVFAMAVLMFRSFKWGTFIARNITLTIFLLFALVSVCWSDYPFVTFKHWLRDLGNYLVILVVLSDPHPVEATRTVLRRGCYILIPLSILLIKYYPAIGKQYDSWTGIAQYAGSTTSKNMLGVLCLVSGLFFIWDTVTRWPHRKERQTKRIILVNAAFIAMTLWLLMLSDSATSRICLVIGCLVIIAAHSKTVQRRPAPLTMLIPVAICAYLVLVFVLGANINTALAQAVGRDATLTDRTKIWSFLLSMKTNPLLGTGYESFWLGPRLEWFWRTSGLGHVNEAHNGFLEVYLNLGMVGLFLLGCFLIASYRTICRRLTLSSLGPLGLALWTVTLFYSFTEAGFRSGFMWLTFLLGAIVVPKRALSKVRVVDNSVFDNAGAKEALSTARLDATALHT
jgi:O-antigen ligase